MDITFHAAFIKKNLFSSKRIHEATDAIGSSIDDFYSVPLQPIVSQEKVANVFVQPNDVARVNAECGRNLH